MSDNPFIDSGTLTWYIILGCLVLGFTNGLLAWRARRKIHLLSSKDLMQTRRSIFDQALFLNALFVMGFWLGYLLAAAAVDSPPFLPVSHGILAGTLVLLYCVIAASTRVSRPSRKGIYGFFYATLASLAIAIALSCLLVALLPAETLAQVFGSITSLSPFTLILVYIDFLFVFPSDYFLLLFVLYIASLFVAIVIVQLFSILVKSGSRFYSRIRNKSLIRLPNN